MERIFLFLYQYRAFFTFLLLELFCAWLIIQNNQYQGARFFNSSNSFVGGVNNFSQTMRDYFSLREVNKELAEENARLRKEVEQQNQLRATGTNQHDSASRFDFESAKVVNNSTDRYTNFITINKGSRDGIASGMAVISPNGVVGKVKMTSGHFSVVTSLLNINLRISGLLKRTGHFGTVQWDGRDPQVVEFEFIPRHVRVTVGDTVVTSGYSGVFPEGIMIGTVEKIELREEAPFYELRVRLAQDFRKLSFVSVVKSNLLHELDSLELQIPDMKR
ncbi:MAG: rod shape-determining protein MreC [Cyclobacteriaceae bacterium]|nr:rod shape-determining protein MreC [Cyclobacteriaceae bacterium]UYN87195.1 MAG: rod shape-determining protein MreC [Cyclobacteriaceae bacterium]